MGQLHANWFAKTNAKTHMQFMQGQHLGFTRCKEELQATKEHKMAMQKHRQPLQQTIPTRTLYKTQGYAHQKLQAHRKHTTLDQYTKMQPNTTQLQEKPTPPICNMQK